MRHQSGRWRIGNSHIPRDFGMLPFLNIAIVDLSPGGVGMRRPEFFTLALADAVIE
jgi:hypothetical protein